MDLCAILLSDDRKIRIVVFQEDIVKRLLQR